MVVPVLSLNQNFTAILGQINSKNVNCCFSKLHKMNTYSKFTFLIRRGCGVALLTMLIHQACNVPPPESPQPVPPALYQVLSPLSSSDTITITTPSKNSEAITALPATTWLSSIDSVLLDQIEFLPDSNDTEAYAYWKTPIDTAHELCLIGFKQNWYHNKSLLIYHLESKKFVGLFPAATFYGGDGGQILTASWLYDFNSDGFLDLTYRTGEHWLKMAEPEPEEFYTDAVQQLLWNPAKARFLPVKLTIDSTGFIERFPLAWWE